MKAIRIGIIAAALGVQGCSALKAPEFVPADPEALTEWSIEGSVTIKDEEGSKETFFEYKNINGEYELAVRPESPVGETGAVVKGTEGEPDSTQVIAKNPKAEKLAKAITQTLPVDNMSYWLRALPATDSAALKQDDEAIVTSMKDDGWDIDYKDFMKVGHYRLPEKIAMQKGKTGVEMNLVRAETGFLNSPCDSQIYKEASGPVAIESLSEPHNIVKQLVPPSGEAPAPRWIGGEDFCNQLVKVHGKVPDPRIGLYGPGSMMWKLVGPTTPAAMGAGRALLLQTAHPWVTAGIDEHSIVRYDPMLRARRTAIGITSIVFGSMPQVMAAANSLHKTHNEIKGKIPYAAGAFKEGSEYRANEVAAMIWIHATLWDTVVRNYEEYIGPLSNAEKERFNEESKLFAMVFGIPESALPRTWSEFEDYCENMFYSPQLTVTRNARHLKKDLFNPGSIFLTFPLWVQEVATAATLPAPVREGYRMDYGTWEKMNYVWINASAKMFDWMMPDSVRINPVMHEAEARLRGERVGWYHRKLIETGLGMERLVN